MMDTVRQCAKCGAPLTSVGGADLCPGCLLEQGLGEPPNETVGQKIGRYKLLEQIGEGGGGVVYVAEQLEPVRRRVALKVIKLGMDTKTVVARFEAERQALAMMDHPNIAKVFDAGATETGRPYFVMELVRGIQITDYCDQNQLATHARLDLFIKVCQAIQHAHQKGIIHRDIKPSNILVTLHDGVPVPKVIDFGIAKATEGRLTEATVYTQLHQFIGTPAYMSPEQAEMSGLDVDTRSDIYSLGVLLYELLTGVTPFDGKELLASGLDEMRRTIREREPARPSTRLATLPGAALTTTAQRRSIDAPKLIHLLQGDLDWIVMKCLEKDRTRRYETANGLAADLKRHLNNEPVVARPPSMTYKLTKFIRRNKLAVAAFAAVLMTLILGIGISTWLALRAIRAERNQAELAGEAAGERSVAEQHLYDLLLSVANSKRQEHRAGYRNEVFQHLRQAASLNVPHKDLATLRDVAVSCLGDVAGLTPSAITNFPANTEIEWLSTDASGRIGAFTLSDGSIQLRTLPSGEALERLNLNPKEPAQRSEFSQDGQQLVSLHFHRTDWSQNSVRLWTRGPDRHWVESSRLAVPHAENVGMLDDKPYACSYDEPARIYRVVDLATQKVIVQLEHIQQRNWILWVLPTSSGLITVVTRDEGGSTAFTVHAWDVRKGAKLGELHPKLGSFAGLYPGKDGRFLACIGDTGVEIYTLDPLERVAELALQRGIWDWRPASFSRNNALLAISLDHRRISVWDWASNREVIVFDDVGLADRPPRLEFDADDRFLFAAGNREAKLYPIPARSERTWVSDRKAEITLIGFNPDSERFAWIGGDGQLVVGEVWTGRGLWETNVMDSQASVRVVGSDIAFSRDGLMAFVLAPFPQAEKTEPSFWHGQRRLRLRNTSSNEPPHIFFPEFTPDGRFLVAYGGKDPAMNDARVHAWRVKSPTPDAATDIIEIQHVMTAGEDLPVMAVHNQRIAYMSLWATNATPEIHLVEIEGQQRDRIIGRGPPRPIGSQRLGFTADGRQVLFVNPNHEIVALDIATGEAVTPPLRAKRLPHTQVLGGFSLSPDDSRLALWDSGSSGVEIWDWKARRYLYSLPGPGSRGLFVRWSLDSQHLAICAPRPFGTSIWHLALVERQLAELGLL